MRILRGRTFDQISKKPVPLARIIIEGTMRGAEADVTGSFTLEIPEGDVALNISTQDYKERSVLVPATQQSIDISLEPSFIQFTSDAPGGGLPMRLHGIATSTSESVPLYVIDSVVINDTAIASGISAVNAMATQDSQLSRIAAINPSDIENVEILRSTSAATFYGSKASNGAVIINTRRGRAGGGLKMDITQRVGVYTLAKKLGARRFNSEDEAVEAFGEMAREYYRQGQFYDHEAELAGRRELSSETVASVSGMSESTRYFGSVLIKDYKGIFVNTGYQRQSFRLNVGQKLGELMDVTASVNLVHVPSKSSLTKTNTDIEDFAYGVGVDAAPSYYHMMLPFTPSFYNLKPGPDGTYSNNPFIGRLDSSLQHAGLVKNDEDMWRIIASGNATLNIYKDKTRELRMLASLGVDRLQRENNILFPPEQNLEPVDDGLPGTSLAATRQYRSLNAGLNVVYNVWPENSGIISNTSAGISLEERDLNTEDIVSRNINAGQPNVDFGTQISVRRDRQFVRGLGYYMQEEALLLDKRLTLIGALRGEQSSTNGDPNKLFLYPKLATAYRVPSFLTAVDELKVSLAYGETGTKPKYVQKFSPLLANGNIGDLIRRGIYGNPKLRPERQREVEASMNAIFMSGNIITDFILYQRNISDLLLPRALAPSLDFPTEVFNGGSLRKRGLEVMVQLNPFNSGEFEWVSNTTFTLNRSKVTDLPLPAFIAGGFGIGLGAFRIEQGQSATQIVGNSGLKPDGTCCMVKKLGDTEPDFRMGFSNSFRYRSWSLSFLLDWQKGSEVINLTRFIYDLGQNSPDYVGAGKQRLKEHATNAGVYIEDASFLKLREITLTYQLPETWVTQVPKMKSARVSFSAYNVFTLTGYSGLDPEVSNFNPFALGGTVNVNPLPPSRSFWASIDVGF
jgi:TonB-dependent SusC/RagA subfamily outer membrane receptor